MIDVYCFGHDLEYCALLNVARVGLSSVAYKDGLNRDFGEILVVVLVLALVVVLVAVVVGQQKLTVQIRALSRSINFS